MGFILGIPPQNTGDMTQLKYRAQHTRIIAYGYDLIGDAMPQDLEQAASLYQAAFNNGVTWAARGLAILYEDVSFGNYNPELAKEWLKKFEGLSSAGHTKADVSLSIVTRHHLH